MAVKTLSLRIDEELIGRIDEWGIDHATGGRYNRNATIKQLIELALEIPTPEEVDDEDVEEENITLTAEQLQAILDDQAERIEERVVSSVRAQLDETNREQTNNILGGTKMLIDGGVRDTVVAVNSNSQQTVSTPLLEMGSDIGDIKQSVGQLEEKEKKSFWQRLFG